MELRADGHQKRAVVLGPSPGVPRWWVADGKQVTETLETFDLDGVVAGCWRVGGVFPRTRSPFGSEDRFRFQPSVTTGSEPCCSKVYRDDEEPLLESGVDVMSGQVITLNGLSKQTGRTGSTTIPHIDRCVTF